MTMAAVRGIGVAVMTSRSGSPSAPLARSVARCSTPKRCCSSITTAPERGELDLLGQQRVGPHHEAHVTRRQSRHAPRRRALPLIRLVSSSTRSSPPRHPLPVPSSSPSSARTAETCCSASTSVGTMSAPWCPLCTAASSAAERDHRLAGSHVALEEAVHGEGAGHVGDDDGQSPSLRRRQLVGQPGQEASHEGVRDAAGDLPRRDVVAQAARVDLEGPTPQHEGELQPEQLVEHQASAGAALSPRTTRAGGCAPNASVRSHRSSVERHSGGNGSTKSPARASASSTHSPISHDVRPALAEAG